MGAVNEFTGYGACICFYLYAILAMPMRTYIFKVVIEEDPFEDGRMAYFASVPALPGCHTWAYTKEELLKNIQEAVQGYIETLVQLGKPIPTEPEVQVYDEPLVSVALPTAL
jgi:predicted RNase H-like HicB family nuclease